MRVKEFIASTKKDSAAKPGLADAEPAGKELSTGQTSARSVPGCPSWCLSRNRAARDITSE
jgi:hypothetical protein